MFAKVYFISCLFQINKPLMEKKRRERINNCLNQLKMFLMDATKKDVSSHKLEYPLTVPSSRVKTSAFTKDIPTNSFGRSTAFQIDHTNIQSDVAFLFCKHKRFTELCVRTLAQPISSISVSDLKECLAVPRLHRDNGIMSRGDFNDKIFVFNILFDITIKIWKYLHNY